MSVALDLYTTAEIAGLKPDLRLNRMQCPCGCDLNKKSYNWATASYFKDNWWECFRCGQKGNAWDLAQMRGLDKNTLPQAQTRIEPQYKKHKPLNLDDAWEQLHSLTDPELVQKWSTEIRGFPKALEEIISQIPEIAHIGKFTPEGDAGELFRTAKYYDRLLLLPIFDPAGNIISIKFLWNGQGEIGERAKAINLQSSKCPEKPSGTPRIFGNLPEAISDAGNSTLYITEGGPDFFALKLTLLYSTGKAPVVGADSVSDLVKIAKGLVKDFEDKLERPNIVIVPHRGDSNQIGEKKALEAAEILFKTGTQVKIATLPEVLGEEADLADCLRDLGIEAVIETIRKAQIPKELLKHTPIIQRTIDSVDDFRKEFPEIIRDSIEYVIREPDVISISSSPGVGKTTTTAEQIIKKVKENNSVALYAAPTHSQLEQIKEQLQNRDINVIHTKGKKSFRKECVQSEQNEISEILGISGSGICRHCEKGPNNIGSFCQYYDNLIKAATAEKNTIILMTTDQWYHLQNRKIWIEGIKDSKFIFENVQFTVLDERPEHGFVSETVIYRNQDPIKNKSCDGSMLHRGDWPKPAKEFVEILYELTAPTPDPEFIKKSKKLKKWYDTKELQQLQGEELYKLAKTVAKEKLGSIEQWENLVDKVKELEPGTNKNPNNTRINLRSLPKWVVDIAQLLDEEPHKVMIRRLPSSPDKPNEGTIHLFDPYQIDTTISTSQDQYDNTQSILILDAYLEQNIRFWKNLLPQQLIYVKDFRIKSDSNKVVVQHVKQNTSRNALSDEKKLDKAVEAAKEAIGNNSNPVVYTHKKNKDRVQEAFPKNIVDYFGRTQGLNDYKGEDILILGSAYVNEAAVKAKIFAMQNREPTLKQVKDLANSERLRILTECAYRARTLDASSKGITITIVSQDTKLPDLIHGVETIYLEDFRQSRLREKLEDIKASFNFFPSLNLLLTKTDKILNYLNKMSRAYKDNIYTKFAQLVEILKKIPERRYKKVFREVAAGMSRARIAKFGDILVLRDMKEKIITALRKLTTLIFKSPEKAKVPVVETVNEILDLVPGDLGRSLVGAETVSVEDYDLCFLELGTDEMSDEFLEKVFCELPDFVDKPLNFRELLIFFLLNLMNSSNFTEAGTSWCDY